MSLSLIKNKNLVKSTSFINGQFISSSSSQKTFTLKNPSTPAPLTIIHEPTQDQIKSALQTAHKTFKSPAYSSLSPYARFSLLKTLHSKIQENVEDLATILTLENGKPLKESLTEIKYAASFIEWFAEEAKRPVGEILAPTKPSSTLKFFRQPVGVCMIITPFNFPAAMITRKLGAAIAAGCTAVIKPSHDTPLTCLALAELCKQAGFPDGSVNVLTVKEGIKEFGEMVCTSEYVNKISFTGSTKVGVLLNGSASKSLKKVSLELGGNAPVLIFDDVNVEEVVERLFSGKFRCSGQTCVSPNRIFVHDNIHDKFIKVAKEKISQLKVGDGLDDVEIGPLINKAAIDKVKRHVEDAKNNGACVEFGGEPITGDGYKGYFYKPTLLSKVTDEMQCFQEETFGPLLAVSSFKSEEEVIERANKSMHGLAGYLFTLDSRRIRRVCNVLECGMVGVNTCAISYANAPFGGIKMSGFGREGHRLGLEEYQQVKYVTED